FSDELATTILPFKASGFLGSKSTEPEMPDALPVIASRGASRLNRALFTPLGLLKSNFKDSARTVKAALTSIKLTTIFDFMWVIDRIVFACCLRKTKDRQEG